MSKIKPSKWIQSEFKQFEVFFFILVLESATKFKPKIYFVGFAY